METIKATFSLKRKYSSEYKEWLSFYPTINKLCFKISPASYFDERAQINSHLTTVIAIAGFMAQAWLPLWCIGIWLVCLVVPFGHFFLNLPLYSRIHDCEYPEYGFYFYGERLIFDSFWWCWGEKKYCFYMPWDWDWVRTSILRKDGTWENELKGGEKKNFWEDVWQDKIWKEAYPYKYVLGSGKVQERTATVTVEEREWRWRWLKEFSFPNKIRKTIAVDFDQEVGERTGSWKGGTMGCSYLMLHGELPEHTLRRMEKERNF